MTSIATRHHVTIGSESVNEVGAHGSLPDRSMLSKVVDVPFAGANQAAMGPSGESKGLVGGQYLFRTGIGVRGEEGDGAGMHVDGLVSVAKAAVVAASPGEDPGDDVVRCGFQGHGVILAADNIF